MINAKSNSTTTATPHGRILHAEDDVVVASFVSRSLIEKGYQVETVMNGAEALAKVLSQSGYYDLIITDQSMPELTGLALVTRLRELDYHGRIIVLAALFSSDVERQFRAVGVDRILWKSANLTPLHNAIAELLNGTRTTCE